MLDNDLFVATYVLTNPLSACGSKLGNLLHLVSPTALSDTRLETLQEYFSHIFQPIYLLGESSANPSKHQQSLRSTALY